MASFFTGLLDWLRGLFWSKEIEVTLVGLQNSGKTSLVNLLASGSYTEEVVPTIGFSMRKVKKGNVTMKIWDLGGQPKFRQMWNRYCRGVNAILFMVDSADLTKIDTARTELQALLEKPELAAIPLLVLGNKADVKGSLKVTELIDRLELSKITDRETSAYSISAKDGINIDAVLAWLTKRA